MCNMTHKIVYSINVYYINIIVYMYKYVCMLVLLLQLILLVTPDNIKTIYMYNASSIKLHHRYQTIFDVLYYCIYNELFYFTVTYMQHK